MELEKVEKEITRILNIDKKNWIEVYTLLNDVQQQESWKGKYKSFTQWVKHYCIETHTHESILWSRLRAGKVYKDYEDIQKAKGIEVIPLEKAQISVDKLVMLDKINKYDKNVASQLVQKVMTGTVRKQDLKEVYKQVRPKDKKDISTNPHNNAPISIDPKEIKEITTNDIVLTLLEPTWLSPLKQEREVKRKYFGSYQDKYKALTEFSAYTGTTKKSRRMDILAIENITSSNIYDIVLHGIEIKTSKSDLKNDYKYTEYKDYCDLLWLAIPQDLIKLADEIKPKDCGIIVISKDKNILEAKIKETATYIKGTLREQTLEKLVLKLL